MIDEEICLSCAWYSEQLVFSFSEPSGLDRLCRCGRIRMRGFDPVVKYRRRRCPDGCDYYVEQYVRNENKK